jgi:hypothetical protein
VGCETVATSHRVRIGDAAGCSNWDRYRFIKIGGRLYQEHRLAWLWMKGQWPKNQIDHLNGDPGDNRFCNLRESTQSQNNANIRFPSHNTSGFKGVSRNKSGGKWQVQIQVKGNSIYLGRYRCLARAAIVAQIAAVMVHREFARVDDSIREALNAPCEPPPRVYIRPPHERARVPCHYIQLGAPSAMFMPQTSRVERGFGVSSHQSSSASASSGGSASIRTIA